VANIAQVPPLFGYVGTSAKDAAQIVLETPQGDPLLATWQYGLGRTVAWTSDATGRWAADWVRWTGFPTFWEQAISWSITQNRESSVESIVDYEKGQARLTVDARGADGNYLNDVEMAANVVNPAGDVTALSLVQVAPGRYEGQFTPDREGAYLLRLTGTPSGEGEPAVAQTSGWVLGYSPEYQRWEPDLQLLESVAGTTGGANIAAEPGQAFAHDLPAERATRPIWPWLTLLAAVLLPVDIALRRLVLTRHDLERAWAVVSGRQRASRTEPQRSEQVGRLFAAKARAASGRGESSDAPKPESERPSGEGAPSAPPPRAEPEPMKSPSPEPGETTRGTVPPAGTLAERLLERRRQERDGDPSS
jgi:hypothetical protein